MSPSNPAAAELVPHAEEVRKTGNHYNDFLVGCTAMGANGKLYHGANTKPTPDSAPDCAEMKVGREVEKDDTTLNTVVVLGEPRAEDTTPTLHCCGERCLPMLKGYFKRGKVVRRDTHFAFVNSRTGHVEEYTLEGLFEAHGLSLDD